MGSRAVRAGVGYKTHGWLLPQTTILFDVPFGQRWRRAAALIGVDFDRLSGDLGHA